MTHDRVMRFVPLFESRDQALRFAMAQAFAWVRQHACADASSIPELE
jgi:hypothetical protein